MGILLEGSFESFYRNYPVPEGVHTGNIELKKASSPTSLFVAGDGDIPANEVRFEEGAFHAQPLGYDRYSRQTFGNSEFIMNVINYMTDETGIMELRSRQFKLRLLDREVTTNRSESLKWKLINTLGPLLVVLISGIIFQLLRKRKYTR